jgi:AbrB family looped-hinge helix DNA binding protein
VEKRAGRRDRIAGTVPGMRTTIDQAGRVVIPKRLREALGLAPGPVEIVQDGAAIRIEPVTEAGTVERRGRLVIDAPVALDDEAVWALRTEGQR